MSFTTVERNAASADFFDAAARGELILARCTSCGALRIPRRAVCVRCGESLSNPSAASGRGALITWARHPAREEDSPGHFFGVVELEEGPWLESTLVGIPMDLLQPGLPLAVVWVSGDSGETYPAFGLRSMPR